MGEERITNMVGIGMIGAYQGREFGVPIPIFYCADCGKDLLMMKQ